MTEELSRAELDMYTVALALATAKLEREYVRADRDTARSELEANKAAAADAVRELLASRALVERIEAELEEWKRVAAEHCDSLDIINEACELAESQLTASRDLVERIEAECSRADLRGGAEVFGRMLLSMICASKGGGS